MFPPDSFDARSSYSPEEDDQVTNLYRRAAADEALADRLLASIASPDAQLRLIPFRHQREFLTRRGLWRLGG